MGVEPAAEKLFAIQQGMATRSQLLAAGVTESALAWRLGRVWKLVLPGVVLGAMGALAPYQRVLAAQLYAGPRAQVTGQVACRLHGLRPSQPISAVHVLVPSTCRARDVAWARITRTTTLEQRLHRHGPIWITPPARAVVDWARGLRSHRDSRALTIEAIQRRLVTMTSWSTNWSVVPVGTVRTSGVPWLMQPQGPGRTLRLSSGGCWRRRGCLSRG